MTLGWLVLTSLSAISFASDYQADLKRLQQSQSVLDQTLSRLGLHGSNAAEADASQRTEAKETPLMRVHGRMGATWVPPGKILYGRTLTRLIVGTETSPALIRLDDAQGGLSNLRLMGAARQSSTRGRVVIEVNRLLLPSKAIPVQASALDESGAFGLEAQVISQKALSVLGAMASSFISGLAASQQTQTVNALGFGQTQTTGRNAVLQGVAQTAADQSKRLIDDATAEKPVLIVEPGTPVTVLIQEEVRY